MLKPKIPSDLVLRLDISNETLKVNTGWSQKNAAGGERQRLNRGVDLVDTLVNAELAACHGGFEQISC